ncbi:adenylyltransferase/cytidyltransferase family protein [Pelomonas sp. CA6]|nr:adenylyltransferase/cytidyltransferase family protein [Pelomonas sp. CA6]MCH7345206.1 adenylyltransferase/cytidyltransferase family protein [Pelomonas sp. CA6]
MQDKWDSSTKCVAPAALLEIAARLARPLVFTNGVFDLLHVGHVSYLEWASRQGASLVVALNGDASAARLGKGDERPLTSLRERMRLVAALGCVAWVSWFDEDRPERLLQGLRPDVYVKGGDYELQRLPEAALVASWGGRTEIAPYLPGHSSTALMRRIQAGADRRAVEVQR